MELLALQTREEAVVVPEGEALRLAVLAAPESWSSNTRTLLLFQTPAVA